MRLKDVRGLKGGGRRVLADVAGRSVMKFVLILIVVVALAIALPFVLKGTSEPTRDGESVANLQSAYNQATAAFGRAAGNALPESGGVTVLAAASGRQTVTVRDVELKGQEAGFSSKQDTLTCAHAALNAGGSCEAAGGVPGKYTAVFEYDMSTGAGELTILTKQQ